MRPKQRSFGIGVPGKEIQDSLGENVVAVAGDHVACAADIDELDLGKRARN